MLLVKMAAEEIIKHLPLDKWYKALDFFGMAIALLSLWIAKENIAFLFIFIGGVGSAAIMSMIWMFEDMKEENKKEVRQKKTRKKKKPITLRSFMKKDSDKKVSSDMCPSCGEHSLKRKIVNGRDTKYCPKCGYKVKLPDSLEDVQEALEHGRWR